MNLYELTGQFLELQEIMESGEYDDEVIADTMESLNYKIEEKADNYAKIIRNFSGEIDAIKTEEKRLSERRKSLEKNVDRLKENLKNAMIKTGKKKFKTDCFSFNIQKNGGALPVVVDVPTEDLPDDLVVVTEKPDLKAIAKLIEETGDVTYGHFGERGESLRIK